MKSQLFTMIEFLVIKTCQIYNFLSYTALRKREAARCRYRVTECASSLRSSCLSRWGALLSYPLASALREREGFGGEKAATCAASLPVPNISTFHIFPASSHALANALQAASRSKNMKLFFRRKAGRQLHVIADLLPPTSGCAPASRPSRTRHRHLAGRRGRGGRRTRPPHTAA